jgi:hypothetical protein
MNCVRDQVSVKKDVNKVANDICHVYMNSSRQTFEIINKYKISKINPGSTENVELLGENSL